MPTTPEELCKYIMAHARGEQVEERVPSLKPVKIEPGDLQIDIIFTRRGGGFAPIMANGVRLTHKPTGIVIEETSEREVSTRTRRVRLTG